MMNIYTSVSTHKFEKSNTLKIVQKKSKIYMKRYKIAWPF